MRRLLTFSAVAVLGLAGCATHNHKNVPYHPVTKSEQTEYNRDALDIYPGEVRNDPDKYMGATVAWVGIVRAVNAKDSGEGLTVVDATLEHHYFDWEQNSKKCDEARFQVSPRGEGMFKTRIILSKQTPLVGPVEAQDYVAPGKLAIVYGAPIGVDPDGTVILKYRYARLINTLRYSTNYFDYGRIGQPFYYVNQPSSK